MKYLLKYVNEAKVAMEIYKDQIEEKINVCLGNVSCDMDSCIGSLLLGYYMTHKNDYFSDYGNYELFWIPVINCPRKEIVARIDIFYHLSKFGIDPNNLVFIDDIDLDFYSKQNLLNLAIIDHNKLDYSQQSWDESVVFIVDHHVDQKAHPKAEKILKFCGSACSLAMDLIFNNNLSHILTVEICRFFSAAILIDTENFQPELKNTKWDLLDEEVFIKMNRIVVSEYYQDLINRKTDRKLNIDLGLDLILRKDYKNYIWTNCVAGISVCFNPIHEIMSEFGVDNLKKKLNERMESGGLQIYGIITQIYLKNGEPFRELMIYDADAARLLKLSSLFEKLCTYPLQKKKFTGLSKNFVFYFIKDASVSRKKVEPILKEVFDQI